MRKVEECNYDCNREELDFLNEKCLSLAKDIIDLDEDIEGLSNWTIKFCDECFNPLLKDIDHNFEVLEKRIDNLNGWLWALGIIEVLLSASLFYLILSLYVF